MYEHPFDGHVYYESQEVAEMAGVSLTRVWQWASNNHLPPYQRGGGSRKYFFRDDDVKLFLEMRKVPVLSVTKKSVRMTKRDEELSSRLAAAKVEAWAASRG